MQWLYPKSYVKETSLSTLLRVIYFNKRGRSRDFDIVNRFSRLCAYLYARALQERSIRETEAVIKFWSCVNSADSVELARPISRCNAIYFIISIDHVVEVSRGIYLKII